MVDKLLSSYSELALTHLLGHDSGNVVGKIAIADLPSGGGSGTGDVVGPGSAINSNIAVFSGATGKLIADGGQAIASLQPLDATLTALGGVATAADRLPYFTGVDAASVTTFTSYARTLLDDADATAARTTLGVSAARIILTANKTFYLNADSGVDSADRGLTAGTPWLTPAYAQRFVAQNYDLAGFRAIFQLQDATAPYNSVDGTTAYNPSLPSVVYWRGNPTTPANVLWQSTTARPVLRIAAELFRNPHHVNGVTMSNANEALIDATRLNAECNIGDPDGTAPQAVTVGPVPTQFFMLEGAVGVTFGATLTMAWSGATTPWSLIDSTAESTGSQVSVMGSIVITGTPTFLGGLFTGINLIFVFGSVTGSFTGRQYSGAYIRNHRASGLRNTVATGASLAGDINAAGGGFISQAGAITRYSVDGVVADGIQTVSPASGASLTVAESEGELNINGAGTIAALTITLKSVPFDNEIVTIRAAVAVTAVTWAGGTFVGAPAGLAIGETRLRYDLPTTRWLALGMSAGGGGGTPGGSTTQVQYNNAGAFAGVTNLTTNGTNITALRLDAAASLDWDNAGTADLKLWRQAAGQLAQVNGSNAQALRIYNTVTSGTNISPSSSEWLEMNWSANTMYLRTLSNGSGTTQAMNISCGNLSPLTIGGSYIQFTVGGTVLYYAASDAFLPAPNGTIDCGRTSSQWKTMYSNNYIAGTKAGAVVAGDLPAGTWAVMRDTSGSTTKLYYNNGGTLMSVALA